MKVNELLDYLKYLSWYPTNANIQEEPSYSTKLLRDLEEKYDICTDNIINHDLSQESLAELTGLT